MGSNWLSSAFITVIGGDHHGKDVFAHYSAIKVANDASGKHEFVVGNIKGGS